MRRALYALVLLMYMATPYVALGFNAGTCQCVVNGERCGSNGVLCHCCMDGMRSMECDDSPMLMSCKGPSGVQISSQPPAITEPVASHLSPNAEIGHPAAQDIASSHGFNSKLLKPPRPA